MSRVHAKPDVTGGGRGPVELDPHDPHTVAAPTPPIVALRLILATLGVLAVALVFGGTTALASSGLPDGRVYEMVTPAENEGAELYVPVLWSSAAEGDGVFTKKLAGEAAVDGDAVVYASEPSHGPGYGRAGDGQGNQYLATRGPDGGWSQVGLQPPGFNQAFYQAFSSDLSVGILQSGSLAEPDAPPLASEAPSEGYPVLYARTTSEDSYRSLFTTTPSGGELPGEFKVYGVQENTVYENQVEFAGASTDFGEVLFEVHGALTSNAVLAPEANNLYVSAGRLRLVNVLPDGVSEPNATFGAAAPSGRNPDENQPDFSDVISADGSRVFWTDLNTGMVYMRENPAAPQSQLGAHGECVVADDACTVPVSLGPAQYWTASVDGQYVFYTEDEKLWRFDAEGVPGHEREELAGEGLMSEGAGVQGVLGAGEDGSDVYFVASGVLASNENSNGAVAELGEYNLYMLRLGGKPVFIAALSGDDGGGAVGLLPAGSVGAVGDWQPGLGHRTGEVTPDGGSVVFESDSQTVNGYSPEVNGQKLEEVYVFEAAHERLSCVSCGSSDDPPEANLETEFGFGGELPPSWSATYQPQWISDNGGRVFFDSEQSLVPQDTNGEQDVYEWERDQEGSCRQEAGCVYLLSSGTSEAASWLISESASGNDAFIATRTKLTPEDGDEAYNLFDARVEGMQPVVPPACTGTGCQGVPASPPTFATPPSVTFSGVGNFSPSAFVPAVKPKPKAKAKQCKKGFVKDKAKCIRRPKAKKVERAAKGRK
jgi:hypothetical protein